MQERANERKYFSAYRQITGDHCPDIVKGFYNKKEENPTEKRYFL